MGYMLKPVSAIAIVFSLAGCFLGRPLSKEVSRPVSPLEELWQQMAGFYDSADQAATDTQYYDIRLAMVPIRVSDENYKWLYVEQAVASAPERPYRIRVYRLEQLAEGRFVSRVYALRDERAYLQAWSDPEKLTMLDTADIDEREGCAVFMTRTSPGVFEGATMQGTCESSLRGASYAQAEVFLDGRVLRSWDRGYDQRGNQVWGAERGPYIFKKRREAVSFSE